MAPPPLGPAPVRSSGAPAAGVGNAVWKFSAEPGCPPQQQRLFFCLVLGRYGSGLRIVGDGRGCNGLLKGNTTEFVSLLVPKGGFGSGKRSSVCEGK